MFEILFLMRFSDAASFFRSAKIFRKNFFQKIFSIWDFPQREKIDIFEKTIMVEKTFLKILFFRYLLVGDPGTF